MLLYESFTCIVCHQVLSSPMSRFFSRRELLLFPVGLRHEVIVDPDVDYADG